MAKFSTRETAKKIFKKICLEELMGVIIYSPVFFKRKLLRVDRRIIQDYFRKHSVKGLHIGCGGHLLNDWLNSDFFPGKDNTLHLDVTKPFPFDDNTFNYVYSEHMIEHISYPQGQQMLAESFRVLKNNGTIRISTPNLAFLIDLFKDNRSELQKRYLEWAGKSLEGISPKHHTTIIMNNFMRDWGHTFVYDEELLRSSLEKAGFSQIFKCELNSSKHEVFRNLDNEQRMPPGFLAFETIVLEGTKVVR